MGSGIPTPPLEDHHHHKSSSVSRKSSSSSKSTKQSSQHRSSKRASTTSISHSSSHSHHDPSSAHVVDGRHKRVWKACERCRMKKTKCDGEFPCKRCKDDGLVCTAGVRKKTEYKQLPRGYAEVLENTQFALIATVHKLYAMVRSGQPWELGEPELNDRGQPVIHNIAHKLGCIRPNSDIDLPVHSIFPEDEAGLAELARQLEEQQKELDVQKALHPGDESINSRGDRASSSDLDHSDFEQDLHDYRRAAFGSGSNPMTMSPQSFASYNDFDSVPGDMDPSVMFPGPSPTSATVPAYANWTVRTSKYHHHHAAAAAPQTGMDITQQFLQTSGLTNVDMLNQGLLESEFGTLKPHVLNCPNPEVMMGMGDPMIYSGYDGEPMRL